jgi:hypothetical protein
MEPYLHSIYLYNKNMPITEHDILKIGITYKMKMSGLLPG